MPKYAWKIDDLIFEEDAKAMFAKAASNSERVLIALCWTTAGRTQEILQLTKDDIAITEKKVQVRMKTLKLGHEGQRFVGSERTLDFERLHGMDANIYLETIIRHVEGLPPSAKVLDYTNRWAEKALNRLGMQALGKPLTPYHFRHSVLSWLAKNGMTVAELMQFKGAKSIRSVQPYLHMVPFVVKLQNLRRDRVQQSEQKDAVTAPQESEQAKA